MISTYRRVLGQPGALAFTVSGLIGRLPIAMVGLGIVLLVSTRTGSYSLAGSVSASYLIANGLFAIVLSRWVDRFGQHRVLPAAIAGFGLGLAMLMTAVWLRWPEPAPHVFAVVAGVCNPQIGACVRARWSYLLGDRQLLQTAFAFEAVADEMVFMVGPTLVVFLSTGVHPLAGLAATIALGVGGTAALVVQRRTEPPPSRTTAGGSGPIGWSILGPLAACALAMGVLFGGTEVATVAFADEHHHKSLAGVMLAVWSLGSLLAGLVTGSMRMSVSSRTRFRWGLLALTLLMLPLPFVRAFPVLAGVFFLAGFAVSPTLIASIAWVEETVPPSRLTEGITVVTTGLGAGVAVGALVVGVVVDRAGASTSYWVPFVAGGCGVVIAFVTAAVTRGHRVILP
ncbi:MAG: MFS transporter [Nocardioidaceae bacterium]